MLRAIGQALLADASPAPKVGPLLVATDALERVDTAAAAALRKTLGCVASAFDGWRPVTVARNGLDAWKNSFRVIQGAQTSATRDYLLENGPVVLQDHTAAMRDHPRVREANLGA